MKLATLCYVRRDGQTLMLHRVKKVNDIHQGKWNGLGGKLNPGESPEECAVREIYEESGLHVRDPQLKGFLTFPAFAKDEDWYVFVFVVEDFEGELIDSPEGNLKWINNSDLAHLELWEGDAIFLPWLERRGTFSGKFIYHDGKLKTYDVVLYGDD
jgi:8-oxo-dGTP diphosphatase